VSRNLAFIIILFISFAACSKHQKTYTLDDKQLVNVLADLHVLEFVLKRKDRFSEDSIKNIFFADMESIYKLPIEEIFENIEKLRNDPVKYNTLYNEVAKIMEEEMVDARKESVQSELKDIQ
jgi:hypothetical protein